MKIKIPAQRSRCDIAFSGEIENVGEIERAFRAWVNAAVLEQGPGGIKRCPSAGELHELRRAYFAGWNRLENPGKGRSRERKGER